MIVAFVLIFILVVFRPWFFSILSTTLSAGDWPYLFAEQIKEFSFAPETRFLWIAPYYQILTKFFVETVGLHWHLIERLLWFWLWIALSFFSSFKLTRSAIGALIYTTNTYALMVVGGGQMGVALAYALSPLVLKRLIEISSDTNSPSRNLKSQISNLKQSILNGLILAVQVMFDPRIAFLTVVAGFGYSCFSLKDKTSWIRFLQSMIIVLIIVVTLHLYWIIPLVLSKASLAGQFEEATAEFAKFLSFATFSQTLSLLHPNWPENIFGKVYFMRPEFLVLPILAFSSLVFLKNPKSNRTITFFALLSLVGAFLAKGASEPFGGVYLWLFEKIPGFNLFRDSTKFYLYVALGYSVLIPFSLERLKEWVNVKGKMSFLLITYRLLPIAFVFFWGFTLQEAVMGKLTGTFQPIAVPQEYVKLKDFFLSGGDYFSTGWYPQVSRFALNTKTHPAIEVSLLNEQSLLNQKIKYLIVPLDVRGEIFITDRKYDEGKCQNTIMELDKVPWLYRLTEFRELAVFEVL